MTRLTIPWPAPALWPNFRSRSHWPKTNATKNARSDAFWIAKEAKVGLVAGDVPIMIHITVHPKTKRHPDSDNVVAALKPVFDGIADALKVNDRFFVPQPPVFAEPIKGGLIVLELEI